MALPQHHPRLVLLLLLLLAIVLSLIAVQPVHGRTSPISDLKSKISGVEELLEEFRKQLQQEQAYKMGSVTDSCVGDFNAARQSIIQAKASIEQGATFFLVPNRVYTWRDCLHACCSQPHCTVAVVQEDLSQPGESLNCYLFNCTYRSKHVCSFAPQQGFSAYSRAANGTQRQIPGPAGPAGPAGVGHPEEDDTQGGTSHQSHNSGWYMSFNDKHGGERLT